MRRIDVNHIASAVQLEFDNIGIRQVSRKKRFGECGGGLGVIKRKEKRKKETPVFYKFLFKGSLNI